MAAFFMEGVGNWGCFFFIQENPWAPFMKSERQHWGTQWVSLSAGPINSLPLFILFYFFYFFLGGWKSVRMLVKWLTVKAILEHGQGVHVELCVKVLGLATRHTCLKNVRSSDSFIKPSPAYDSVLLGKVSLFTPLVGSWSPLPVPLQGPASITQV